MKNLLIIIFLFILASCTTTRYMDKPVYIDKIRTEYINKYYKDSVFIHDSIDRYISNDTVYLYKYKYIYQNLIHTDTIIRTDTIKEPVEIKTVEVKEVNKLKWYQKILMCIGGVFILIIIFKLGKKLR